MKDLWISAVGGLVTLGLLWLFNHGRSRARMMLKAKAEARVAWNRRAAAGIKGDGFSALFHLHRALHVRLLATGWLLAGGFCIVLAVLCGRWPWVAGACMLVLQYCTLRLTYLGAKAAAMVEVAEEAVAPITEMGEEETHKE